MGRQGPSTSLAGLLGQNPSVFSSARSRARASLEPSGTAFICHCSWLCRFPLNDEGWIIIPTSPFPPLCNHPATCALVSLLAE